ncbi:MAG: SGNH/GDSL hydrolase family protein [Deltaproteobacteria bacterium]|nr:SGNH/GDSL hydrolase family protein [Deltaproteobacteria bacterium]
MSAMKREKKESAEQGHRLPRSPGAFWLPLSLILASMIICFLSLEAVVRMAVPGFRGFTQDDKRLFTKFDSYLGWRNVPGSKGVISGPGYFCSVHQNLQGLRDVEHERMHRPGIARVVVLGDSMVWGLGVEDDEIMARRAGARLPGVEFISMGTSGYGTDQEFMWLQQDGLLYSPDLVFVVMYYANDMLDNTSSRRYSRNKPFFHLEPTGSLKLEGIPVKRDRSWLHRKLINPIMDPLRNHSALFNLVTRRQHVLHERFRHRPWYRKIFGRPGDSDWLDLYLPSNKPWVKKAMDVTRGILAEFRETCEDLAAGPVVILLPHEVEVEPGEWERMIENYGLDGLNLDRDEAGKKLKKAFSMKGIRVIDPVSEMRKAARTQRLYYPGDGHLTRFGQDVLGRIIAQETRKLLEARKTGDEMIPHDKTL